MKVTNYKEIKDELLKDPDVRAEYEALSLEYALSQSLSENRKKRKLTQKQLSEISGVDQADICRIENGEANPSLETIEKLVIALDCRIVLVENSEG